MQVSFFKNNICVFAEHMDIVPRIGEFVEFQNFANLQEHEEALVQSGRVTDVAFDFVHKVIRVHIVDKNEK